MWPVTLLYRHEDGRLIELKGSGSKTEVWLIYPHRELLEKADSLDAAKEGLPEGFELDANAFAPPCPHCGDPSPLDLESGMYVCRGCDDPRAGPF